MPKVVDENGKFVKRFPYTEEGMAAAEKLADEIGGEVIEEEGEKEADTESAGESEVMNNFKSKVKQMSDEMSGIAQQRKGMM
jgi:hypothetical protein